MIKLFYSNDAQYLARLLCQELDRERPKGTAGVFHSSQVMVPNLNVASFLKFEIAKASGLCANVQFSFLDKFLSRLLPQGTTVLDRDLMRSLLVRHFLDHRLSHAGLPVEIRDYLAAAGSEEGCSDRWVYQLADRLSRSFHEYSLARPAMLDAWLQKELVTRSVDRTARATEQWQQKLWKSLFGAGGTVETLSRDSGRSFRRFDELPELLETRSAHLPGQVHVFGFSYLSRTHNRILSRLASRIDLLLYTVNPCREFWEDVLTPAEISSLKQRYLDRAARKRPGAEPDRAGEDGIEDPYHLDDTQENDFLQRWGRPGRENIHVLNDMVQSDFGSAFIDPSTGQQSLLARIQQDILNRTIGELPNLPVGSLRTGDQSLRIIKCPEIRREVEIIANEIWDIVRADHAAGKPASERLRFNDIAVIIANAGEYDSYTTHISSVFHSLHQIPHTVSDLAPDSSRMVEAVQLLLSLPTAPATRSELLRVLTHPALLNRFEGVDAEEWVVWCRDLAIHHGESREDHKGSYIEKDLYNWDQGVRRLALGVFLEGKRSGEERPYQAGGEQYLPQDMGQASVPNAARFIAIVRSLLADRAYARDAVLTLSEWASFMTTLTRTYLMPGTPGDQAILNNCLAEIAGLARLDVRPGPLPFPIAREFALTALSSVKLSRGPYLADGVVVTSFQPMRPVPFKVVFIAGMGEGCFPAREMRDPLDLRNSRRLAGDVTARERDQYNFLETLVSTRDRLRLTYVSRDSQTGENIEPSSVIKELQFVLEHRYRISPEDLRSLVVEHPLRRFDDRYFGAAADQDRLPSYSAAALQEAQAVQLSRGLRELLRRTGARPDGALLKEYAGKQCADLLYPVAVPADACGDAVSETVQVPIHALRKFLECPLQGWASFHLGLREEENDDPRTSADEIMSSDSIEALMAERRAFMASRGRPDAGEACEREYAAILALNELRGTAPTGIFLETENQRALPELTAWQENYEMLPASADATWTAVCLGSAGEHDQAGLAYPALMLEVRKPQGGTVKVEVSGSLEYVTNDLGRCLRLVNKDRELKQKDFLYHFVAYMVLLASGRLADGRLEAIVLSRKNSGKAKGLWTIVYSGVTQEQAKAYLAALASAMLFETHAYLLPVEAVVEHHWKSAGRSIEEIVEDLKEDPWSSLSSRFGPLSHPEDYAAPGNAEALRMIQDRFGLWFAMMPGEWKR